MRGVVCWGDCVLGGKRKGEREHITLINKSQQPHSIEAQFQIKAKQHSPFTFSQEWNLNFEGQGQSSDNGEDSLS